MGGVGGLGECRTCRMGGHVRFGWVDGRLRWMGIRAGASGSPYPHVSCLPPTHAGAVPDDCTERVLALAFGSHPALAAEVVAEARAIQRQRRGAADAADAAAADVAAKDAAAAGSGQGEGKEEELESEDAGAAGAGEKRPPYRLHQHRQRALMVDQQDYVSRRDPGLHRPLGLLLDAAPATLPSSGGLFGGGRNAAAGADGTSSEEAAEEERVLQLRQLLVLDLHGSSQAAARMVLLRRLEALVHAAPQLEAAMAQQEAAWYRRHEEARLRHQRQKAARPLRRKRGIVAGELLAELEEGSSSSSSGTHQGEAAVEPQQQGQGQQQGKGWPALGQAWQQLQQGKETEATPATPTGAVVAGQQDGRQVRQGRGVRRFSPPPLNIITGMGRHSKGSRGGVLKAAVSQLLVQQGLPVVDDPSNEGGLGAWAGGWLLAGGPGGRLMAAWVAWHGRCQVATTSSPGADCCLPVASALRRAGPTLPYSAPLAPCRSGDRAVAGPARLSGATAAGNGDRPLLLSR